MKRTHVVVFVVVLCAILAGLPTICNASPTLGGLTISADVERTAGNSNDGPYILAYFTDATTGDSDVAIENAAFYLPQNTWTNLTFDSTSPIHIYDYHTGTDVPVGTLADFLAANPGDASEAVNQIYLEIGDQGPNVNSPESLSLDGLVIANTFLCPTAGSFWGYGSGSSGTYAESYNGCTTGITLNISTDSDGAALGFSTRSISPVPEPTAFVMFGTGLVGMFGVIRKKLMI